MHLIEGLRLFLLASGCVGVHSTHPLVRLVRLVPMEYHLFRWYSIGEMHLIRGIISVGFRLSRGAFSSSIGTIGTNGISVIPLVFYWCLRARKLKERTLHTLYFANEEHTLYLACVWARSL